MSEAPRIQVIVFDFDGTLVDSSAPKRRAFYQLFPDRKPYRSIIDAVLAVYVEESRYVILEQVLGRLEDRGVEGERGTTIEKLAERYNELALAAVTECAEKPNASQALANLGQGRQLYLSSGTPVLSLMELVARRGWAHHFEDVFGYPATKVDTLATIMKREDCPARQVLVVGDGHSDQESARVAGCGFFPVAGDDALSRLLDKLY